MKRSAKKNRRVLHRQCDLYSLYLWPRVFVTVVIVKNHPNLQTDNTDLKTECPTFPAADSAFSIPRFTALRKILVTGDTLYGRN